MYGQALKHIRKFKRMTQWELGQKLGVTAGYICVLEQGRAPQLNTLEKYAAYLKVPLSQLVAFAELINSSGDSLQYSETMGDILDWVKDTEAVKKPSEA